MIVLPVVVPSATHTNVVAGNSGTNITAGGTAHVKGAWASLIAETLKPSYGIWVHVSNVGASATNTSGLLDIGLGDVGGGNEVVVIPDLDIGAAGEIAVDTAGGKGYFFPVFIPAGVSIRARSQSVIVSDTVLVAVWLFQDTPYPWTCGSVSAYGVVSASSCGTLVPVANNAFGTWTQITSATDRDHRFWTVGFDQGGDTTLQASLMNIRIGFGPSSSDVTEILTMMNFVSSSTEGIAGPMGPNLAYKPVPAGSTLFASIAGNHTESRGIIIYGMD